MIEDTDIENYLAIIEKARDKADAFIEGSESYLGSRHPDSGPCCNDAPAEKNFPSRFMVFGDSHSSFFAGEDKIVEDFRESTLFGMNFHVFHMGPVLAASLVERQSTLMARERIFDILKRENPADWDGAVFAFGEIDCRFHIIKRLGHKNAAFTPDLQRSITITVLRYLAFLHEVVLQGYKPIVWGPVASNCLVVTNPEWPNYGTSQERNVITLEFSRLLGRSCETSGIEYITVLPFLLTDTMGTRSELYFDGGHLGQTAWQIALPLFRERLQHILHPSMPGSRGNKRQEKG